MPRLAAGLAVVALSLGVVSPARAECPAYVPFEGVARESPVVVVGRVAAAVILGKSDPARVLAVDLEVSWVAKGFVADRRVRVWDPLANTWDNAELHRLTLGKHVALAASPIRSWRASSLSHPTPERLRLEDAQLNDLWVGSCSESFRLFDTERAAGAFVRKTVP